MDYLALIASLVALRYIVLKYRTETERTKYLKQELKNEQKEYDRLKSNVLDDFDDMKFFNHDDYIKEVEYERKAMQEN